MVTILLRVCISVYTIVTTVKIALACVYLIEYTCLQDIGCIIIMLIIFYCFMTASVKKPVYELNNLLVKEPHIIILYF